MAQKNKYKIGFVLDDGLDKPDGVQQYLFILGDYFSSLGHDVHYLVGETKRTDIPNVHSISKNMKVIFNGNRMSMPLPASRAKIKKLLDDEEFDVLHIQTPYSPFMGHKVLLSAPESTALISTFHIAPNSGLVHVGTKLLGLWLQRSLKQVDRMISVSTAAQEFSRDTFGFGSEVVPNPVDYDKFHSAKPYSKYTSKTKNILFLGRFVPRKGAMVLLESIVELKKRKGIPDFRVILCGKGPLQAKIESFIQENRLEDTVELVGFVSEEDKPRYYASSDISVFPSTGGESFGIVLTEAMASGKAVVLGGDNAGYRSVLGVQSELLFDTNSPKQLTDLLENYLKNPKEAKKMAKWGEEYTLQYDKKVVASRLLDIYAEVLRKK